VQRLPITFAERDALVVAPDLLNKVLLVGGRSARIVEVEAYTADDPASHSFRGPTRRNAAMFGPPGRWYVYLIYGIHHCLNLVTGAEGDGQAVLIRSVLIDGVDPRRTRGPGRLSRELAIDRSLDGSEAVIVDEGVAPPVVPRITPRIGITKAVDLPRRWLAE
jgi:DNA-3-methyladenine glycosylase